MKPVSITHLEAGNRRTMLLALVVLTWFTMAHGTFAQSYSIKWFTIGGGGGRSVGDGYTVHGTAGQHDAGSHSGGVYSMMGGFWSVAAAVSDDAPALRIFPTGRGVLLAWPDPSTGFQLQQSTGLTPPVWTDVRDTPTVVGTEKQVTLPLQSGGQFFRLRQAEAK